MSNKPYIKIIELHFSNRCTGTCVICSRAHGYESFPYCTPDVFRSIVDNLKHVDFSVIQLGGDGDSFLNPNFLDYVKILRTTFPDKTLTLFTNAYMLNESNSNRIIQENLLNNIETRIDTLNEILFRQSTGLDLSVVLNNLTYFMRHNHSIKNHIIYFPLFLYRECVREMLGKEPTYFDNIDESLLKNEYLDVYRFFKPLAKPNTFNFRISEICLWGERTDVKPRVHLCSQLNGAFKNQVYIYPNGNIGLCPYDDGQNTFILGNITRDKLNEIWTSATRLETIDNIVNYQYVGTYPCIDPVACDSFDFYRKKVNLYDLNKSNI
jgi:radical SAM protein with 4Fe4S-binding SPASM domain